VTGWQDFDPGAARLLLVGPILAAAPDLSHLAAAGLADMPQVAVDRGINFSAKPVLWAGDGDSGAAPADIPAMLKKDQDKTDLRFCLDGIRGWRWRSLHLIGFIGARRDHELANYGEIFSEIKRRPAMETAVFYDQELRPQVQLFPAGEHRFARRGLFSLLVLDAASITIAGECRWPALDLPLDPLSGRGLSNEAFGNVTVRASQPFALIFADD
jgi:thiamine pyrophosphokinase